MLRVSRHRIALRHTHTHINEGSYVLTDIIILDRCQYYDASATDLLCLSTVAQKYIRVSRFPFLIPPSFLCLAFPVRPHLCFAFPISHSALICASRFPFVLICASRFPFLIPPSFVPRVSRSSSFALRVSHFSFRPHSCPEFLASPSQRRCDTKAMT